MILHITWKLCCLVFIYASNTGFLLYLMYRLHPQRALSLITCPSETVKKKKERRRKHVSGLFESMVLISKKQPLIAMIN